MLRIPIRGAGEPSVGGFETSDEPRPDDRGAVRSRTRDAALQRRVPLADALARCRPTPGEAVAGTTIGGRGRAVRRVVRRPREASEYLPISDKTAIREISKIN